jgi:hypothetical protein
MSKHYKTLAVALSVSVLIALLLTACQREPELNPVVVIGIDGATWDVIEPMIADGDLPNLAKLKARGSWGRLITVGPQVSPVVWTTFATGHFGRRHGILDFVYPYTPGPKSPVESIRRQVPAIWNIASDAGKNVGVVGYFASHPSEPINGAMVTDRAYQRLRDAIHPRDKLAEILPELDGLARRKHQKPLWDRFLPWDYDPREELAEDSPYYEANLMVAKRVDHNIVYSEYLRRVTNHLLEKDPYDLFITYFRGPDVMGHSLWWYYDDSEYDNKPDPFTKGLLENGLPESYRFVDEVIGDIIERVPENTNFVLISDHGSGSATGRYTVKKARHKLLTGNHRPDGIFLAAGPDIVPGRVEGLTIMEIFPMMAALSGLPISDELPGSLDFRPFREGFFKEHPLQTIKSYPPRQQQVVSGDEISEVDQQEVVQSLKGLGYVGEGFELGQRAGEQYQDFWNAEQQLVLFQVTGELVYWVIKEQVDTAIQILELTWQHRPDVARALINRTRTEFEVIAERFDAGFLPEPSLQEFLAQAQVIHRDNKHLLADDNQAVTENDNE